MLKKILAAGFVALASATIYASDVLFIGELPLVWQPIVIVSGGPVWASPGQDQYIYPITPPPGINHFLFDSPSRTLGEAEVFFGLQRLIQPWLTGQLGLGIAGASNAEVTGFVNIDGAPEVYDFQYYINHWRIELKGKLIDNAVGPVQPYVTGSFGAGWNNSHDYIPSVFSPVAPWFQSNTTIAFSYSFGAGIQANLSRHWQVGMGYEFADWGKSFLQGGDPNYFQGISLTHLYTNQLLFSVGYIY